MKKTIFRTNLLRGLFKCKTKLTDKNTSIRRLKAILWDALATEPTLEGIVQLQSTNVISQLSAEDITEEKFSVK